MSALVAGPTAVVSFVPLLAELLCGRVTLGGFNLFKMGNKMSSGRKHQLWLSLMPMAIESGLRMERSKVYQKWTAK